jgi:hypothetical protein
MAEIKKLWLVVDAPTGEDNTLDYLWEDKAIHDEEHRLAHYCGALPEGGYDIYQFIRVWTGGVEYRKSDNPKVYDDAASAKKDAEKRLAKARAAYEKRTGKTAPKTASMTERVITRFQGVQ